MNDWDVLMRGTLAWLAGVNPYQTPGKFPFVSPPLESIYPDAAVMDRLARCYAVSDTRAAVRRVAITQATARSHCRYPLTGFSPVPSRLSA
jgi:hypothetical protein